MFVFNFMLAFAQEDEDPMGESVLLPHLEISGALNDVVKKVSSDRVLQNGTLGFYAVEVNSGKVLAAHEFNKSLIPASTMKAVTTSTALLIFGKDEKFYTSLQYSGHIDSAGILHGNIFIVGGGDPTLGSVYFNAQDQREVFLKNWVSAIKSSGIKKITGKIIADDSVFEGEPVPSTWNWGDLGNYYGAGAAGLSVYDNTYEIELTSGKPGNATTVKKITPFIPYMDLKNEVKSANTATDNSCIYGSPGSCERVIKGAIPSNKTSFKVKGSIPDPALLTAYLLNDALIIAGVEIEEKPTTIKQTGVVIGNKELIFTHSSPTLDSIVYWTNLKSINPFAEHLINHLGLKKYGIGDTYSGAQAITTFWRSKGIDVNGLFIADGSGLSRSNGITTKQLTEIMRFMAQSDEFDSFYASLPIAGKTGSIAGMCRGTAAENNLRAKSGYINRVRSYTGYVTNKSGNLIAFTMIANNYICTPSEMKQRLEKIMIALANSTSD
jgi:serine-type D-Ala-D-Ala carboxypeptidase/endopeptidase (penicillin-binding protein 4)